MTIGDAICKYLQTRSDDKLFKAIMDYIYNNKLVDDRGINLKSVQMPIDKKIEFEYLVNGFTNELIHLHFSKYPHLIALIQTNNYGLNVKQYSKGGFYWNELEKKYREYFGNIFSDDEIEKMIHLHMDLDNDNRMYGIDDYSSKIDLIWLLEIVQTDRTLLKQCQSISDKFELSLKQSLHICRNYYNFPLWRDLLYYSKNIDQDLIKKIKYIANTSKVQRIQTIDDVISNSYDNIKSFEVLNFQVKNMQRGGPKSTTEESSRCFNGLYLSQEREVRSILPNGDNIVLSFGEETRHEEAVRKMYSDLLPILKTIRGTQARNLAFYVSRELNAITYIIEKNYCQIYVPEKITKEQAEKCKLWLENGKNGIFGICVCIPSKMTIKVLKDYEDGRPEFDYEKAQQFISELKGTKTNNNGIHI